MLFGTALARHMLPRGRPVFYSKLQPHSNYTRICKLTTGKGTEKRFIIPCGALLPAFGATREARVSSEFRIWYCALASHSHRSNVTMHRAGSRHSLYLFWKICIVLGVQVQSSLSLLLQNCSQITKRLLTRTHSDHEALTYTFGTISSQRLYSVLRITGDNSTEPCSEIRLQCDWIRLFRLHYAPQLMYS
jgi:hypothetical protein